MSKEGDLHAALMGRVETLSGYTLLWPQKGGDKPSGEHVRVYHIPNDTGRLFLSNNAPREWLGFVVLTLVSPLGEYEVVAKRKAGEIASHFLDQTVSSGTATATFLNTAVRGGREEGTRWETPIWLSYKGYF